MQDIVEAASPGPKEDSSWTIGKDSQLVSFLVDSVKSSYSPQTNIPTEPKAMRENESPYKTRSNFTELKKNNEKSSYAKRHTISENDHYSRGSSSARSSRVLKREQQAMPILSESNSAMIKPREGRIHKPRKERKSYTDPDEDRHPSSLPPPRELKIRSKEPPNQRPPVMEKSSSKKRYPGLQPFLVSKLLVTPQNDVCYNCGRSGHSFMDCKVMCGSCNGSGHKTIWCSVLRSDGRCDRY